MKTRKSRSETGRSTSVPGQSPKLRLRRILVPLDLSGESRQALPVAIELARKFNARIALVHVVAPMPIPAVSPAMGVAVPPPPVAGLRKQAAAQLHERGEKLVPRALYERGIVTLGHPASEIIRTAERIDADLIVLSTHGHSGVKRFLLGSTAEQIVRHAKCPVMTVRISDAAKPRKAKPQKRPSRSAFAPPIRAL